MPLLLDTDILIDVQRHHPPAVAWFSTLAELPSVPGFVVMELIQDASDAAQVRAATRLVAPLPVAWPSPADCREALADFQILHLSHRIGLIDALIAATARGLDADLCTFNLRHYRAVPRLRTIQPYVR